MLIEIASIIDLDLKIEVLKEEGLTDVERLFKVFLTLFGNAERKALEEVEVQNQESGLR
jgi:hypothetical protein